MHISLPVGIFTLICKLGINLLKEFTTVAKKTSKGLLIHLGQLVKIGHIFLNILDKKEIQFGL